MERLRTKEDSARDAIREVVLEISRSLESGGDPSQSRIAVTALHVLDQVDGVAFIDHSETLSQVSIALFEAGQSSLAIEVGRKIAAKAALFANRPIQRRISNILGAQYCDTADFASAMTHLETAVALARQLGEATGEAACLANVMAVLQEMGHYRQAILLAERVLRLDDTSHIGQMLKLQCASNGLFAAHRVGDATMAARFLSEGQLYISAKTEPLRLAFFERSRVLYLVDMGEVEIAREHLDKTSLALGGLESPRINTLLTISEAICDWASGLKTKARSSLGALYGTTRQSRLYHHFVLQALTKVHTDPDTPAEAATGLAYAKELVEYTTSVKKAKFYRQLANKREGSDRAEQLLNITSIEAFDAAKEWLSASDVLSPVGESISPARRELAKHEELTAIHEDMAKLRVASLRREIRTDAVDTAENWALAAEFFDDETGQHCYRVGHLASMLAREINMSETFCLQVEHAARLHDIGKIAVNEVILLKPGPLDASEMAAMRLHTEVGAQILCGSDDPTLKMAVQVARHHHEWWNGAGYPAKLAGKEIPLSARVSAYADVYDALTHARAYKKAWEPERALEEILRLVGTQFDPELASPFCKVLSRYRVDLESGAIPAFVDMASNALISSRRKLMDTISGAKS